MVGQCRQSQLSIQRFIERGTNDEQLLFEALNVNDELQRVLGRFEQMCETPMLVSNQSSGPALIPVGVVDDEEALVSSSENSLVRKAPAKTSNLKDEEATIADLDEMIFGRPGPEVNSHKDNDQGTRKKNSDDLIDL